MSAYKKFKDLGIYTPWNLSAWAANRGFLGVHIVYTHSLPVHEWQVRRYNVYKSIASFPAWSNKAQAEEAAKDWASAHYGVDCWCRIAGMGNALFPLAVAQHVKEQVGVSYYKRRQHSKGK